MKEGDAEEGRGGEKLWRKGFEEMVGGELWRATECGGEERCRKVVEKRDGGKWWRKWLNEMVERVWWKRVKE